MAGASDKARFYLEQYVPELQSYSRKGLFTPQEISAIASKRSDFEHILNARGSTPADYARYAEYEMNLSALLKKRRKRLRVKDARTGSTAFSAQRTIFFILDRGTRKFPGDMGLWMQYIRFCQQERANKKLARVLTSVLRLKPREYGLWVLAAKHYAEGEGDMRTARSYMQRGLRFCKDERRLWAEYLRLEMVYLAKLAARRKVLGLDQSEERERQVAADENEDEDEDEDMVMLPTITAEDINGPDASTGVNEVDDTTLQKLSSAPAFTGAIPIAIFDAAMKQFDSLPDIAEELFDIVASFDQVPSSKSILQHVLDHMRATAPDSPEAVICEAKLHLFAIPAQSADFPAALGMALAAIKRGFTGFDPRGSPKSLANKATSLLLSYLEDGKDEGLDEDVVKVLTASIHRYTPQHKRGIDEYL